MSNPEDNGAGQDNLADEARKSRSTADRPVKRRASQACHICRARKVKCDLVSQGPPCKNCSLHNLRCIVPENRRIKKPWLKVGPKVNIESSEGRSSNDPDQSPQSRLARPFPVLPQTTLVLDSDHDANATPTGADEGHQHQVSSWESYQDATDPVFASSAPITSPVASVSAYSVGLDFDALAHMSLPPYIQPFPSRIGPDELDFSMKKGAHIIPDLKLRNELLRNYVEFVHPSLPVLDLNDLLLSVELNGRGARVSLLLFQAVMFVASAFVDEKYLLEADLPDRKEARKLFFQKIKVLYDIDYESDSIVLLQALILMTDWYERPNDQKNTRYWVGVAVSVARRLELDRNPGLRNLEDRKKRLYKRIWWSCCMRDWLTSLAMRRPPYIKHQDHDVAMLELDDFDVAALPDSASCISADCTLARDIEQQRILAIVCIEKVKLCVCIPDILLASYDAYSTHESGFTEQVDPATDIMLRPKSSNSDLRMVESCDKKFKTWISHLPEEAQWRPSSIADSTTRPDDVIGIHRSLLHMQFYAFLSTLHRPGFLSATKTRASDCRTVADAHEYSRKQVQRAAEEITRTAEELNKRNMVQYLPTTGVWVMLPAIIYHLSNMNGPIQEALASRHGFDQCAQVVDKLRSKYAAAEVTYGYLNAARMAISRAQSVMGDANPDESTMTEPPIRANHNTEPPNPQGWSRDQPLSRSGEITHSSTAEERNAHSLTIKDGSMDNPKSQGFGASSGEGGAHGSSNRQEHTEDFGTDFGALVDLDAMIQLFSSSGDTTMFDG